MRYSTDLLRSVLMLALGLCWVGCGDDTGAKGAGGEDRPAALVGHWRVTETMVGDGFSLVTDTNIVLNADGTFSTWTKTESGSGDPAVPGDWKTEGKLLLLRPSGGQAWSEGVQFGLTDDGKYLRLRKANGDSQVFERQ